jgi:hypothetical protein
MTAKTTERPRAEVPQSAGTVLTTITSDALILELRARRKTLTAEQHSEIIGIGLQLCSECMTQVRAWMPAHGWGLVQFVRRHLWRWLRSWPHGSGCPKDAI